MGSAPYLGGGFGHFYAYAPTKIEYAIDRFAMETKRQLDVLDRRLAESKFLAGDDYTIADIAVWPWYGGLAKGLLYGAGEFLAVTEYKNVQRWADAIGARPAVKRGRIVNRMQGDPASQLRERHDASDFELRTAGQDGGRLKLRAIVPPQRSWGGVREADGGVMQHQYMLRRDRLRPLAGDEPYPIASDAGGQTSAYEAQHERLAGAVS